MASMDLTTTNTEFVLRLYVDINNQELRNIYNEAVEKHNESLYSNPYKDSHDAVHRAVKRVFINDLHVNFADASWVSLLSLFGQSFSSHSVGTNNS